MEQRGNFILFKDRQEFSAWIFYLSVNRKIMTVQNHHTYSPSYEDFNGNNHFERMESMRSFHINNRKFADIAQNLTTFPDGSIGYSLGRSFEKDPAGIYGNNKNSICIEHFGNFDIGGDSMTDDHRKTIVFLNAILCLKFDLKVNTYSIVYHHWFDPDTGKRLADNDSIWRKSCCGTNFFGGNKIKDSENNFIPLVVNEVNKTKNVKTEEGATMVQVDKIRVASGTGKRIDGDHNIKGSDVRVIKVNPEEYDIEFVVSKGKTVEQIGISENADFAINAPYFSGNQIIGYSKNETGLISSDAAGSKTNSWYGFALKNGIPYIGAIYGKDIVDFAFKSSPFLVDNGKNVANERVVIEQTASDIKDAPKPRTALFLDENNHIIITVVDGWTKKNLYKYDRGLYLDELADMGIGLGAKRGIGLDGGGSCSLYVKGQGLINALQDGVGRITGHALVFKKKATVKPVPIPVLPKPIVTPVEDKLPLIQRTVKVIVNGKETESTGYLINGLTYLPIRTVTDSLDGIIGWDAKTFTATITKK